MFMFLTKNILPGKVPAESPAAVQGEGEPNEGGEY